MRRARAPVVAAFLVALVGEALFRLLGPAVPVALYAPRAEELAAEMSALRSCGLGSDVAFIGTSMIGEAVDTSLVEDSVQGVDFAHNLALPGASTLVVKRWLTDFVVPSLRPSQVVWGLSSLELNAGRRGPKVDLYEPYPPAEAGMTERLVRGLEEHSALAEAAGRLTGPAGWDREAAFAPATATCMPRAVGRLGNWNVIGGASGVGATDRELRRLRVDVLGDFAVGREHLDAVARALDVLEAEGIEVTIVLMPVPSGYLDAHPGGPGDFQRAMAAVRSVAASRGVAVVDHTRDFDDGSFADFTHLTPLARGAFSSAMAQVVASRSDDLEVNGRNGPGAADDLASPPA